MLIGFSTGAIAKGDYQRGVDVIRAAGAGAVELSALREGELGGLIAALNDLDLSAFQYVAFHAPGSFSSMTEREAVTVLETVAARNWPIVLHPDSVTDWSHWAAIERHICVENMDGRKRTGRTVDELDRVFESVPEAGFCFDIGHAFQLDGSMQLAWSLWRRFRSRVRQVHVSRVDSRGRHCALDEATLTAFAPLLRELPSSTPLILESVIDPAVVPHECRRLRASLATGRPVVRI